MVEFETLQRGQLIHYKLNIRFPLSYFLLVCRFKFFTKYCKFIMYSRKKFGIFHLKKYYFKLFKKIKRTKAERILEERVRIPNRKKARILVTSYVRHNLNML